MPAHQRTLRSSREGLWPDTGTVVHPKSEAEPLNHVEPEGFLVSRDPVVQDALLALGRPSWDGTHFSTAPSLLAFAGAHTSTWSYVPLL